MYQPPSEPETPIPPGMGNALRGMANGPFLLTRNYQEQQWRAERKGAHPNILIWEKIVVKRLAAVNVPMFSHEIIRGLDRQMQLYNEGFSKAKPGSSAHQYGCADDLIHGVKAWDLSTEAWLLIGHIGKDVARQLGVPIVWGGDWKKPGQKLGWDPAHWELANWREIKKAMDDAEWGGDPKTAFEVAYAIGDMCQRAKQERWPSSILPDHFVDWHEAIRRAP